MRSLILPPATLLMSAVLMTVLHSVAPIVRIVPRPMNWVGLVLVVAGLAVAIWHSRLFGRLGTNIDTFGVPDVLTTEGLYGRTRNPMYLGMLTALLGIALVLGSVSPVAVLLGFALLLRFWYVAAEERTMLQVFGARYLEYQRQVPRWL